MRNGFWREEGTQVGTWYVGKVVKNKGLSQHSNTLGSCRLYDFLIRLDHWVGKQSSSASFVIVRGTYKIQWYAGGH